MQNRQINTTENEVNMIISVSLQMKLQKKSITW